ncbi:hypothetical protein RYX41_08215 [Lactiplantibacillus plantarum]|nr:hypothetical protein [Lactiplantibacillus plantarum]
MYEEDIEHALRARKYNAIRADERELINAIAYDTTGIIKGTRVFTIQKSLLLNYKNTILMFASQMKKTTMDGHLHYHQCIGRNNHESSCR